MMWARSADRSSWCCMGVVLPYGSGCGCREVECGEGQGLRRVQEVVDLDVLVDGVEGRGAVGPGRGRAEADGGGVGEAGEGGRVGPGGFAEDAGPPAEGARRTLKCLHHRVHGSSIDTICCCPGMANAE